MFTKTESKSKIETFLFPGRKFTVQTIPALNTHHQIYYTSNKNKYLKHPEQDCCEHIYRVLPLSLHVLRRQQTSMVLSAMSCQIIRP